MNHTTSEVAEHHLWAQGRSGDQSLGLTSLTILAYICRNVAPSGEIGRRLQSFRNSLWGWKDHMAPRMLAGAFGPKVQAEQPIGNQKNQENGGKTIYQSHSAPKILPSPDGGIINMQVLIWKSQLSSGRSPYQSHCCPTRNDRILRLKVRIRISRRCQWWNKTVRTSKN